jgi:purine nucleosidase
VTRKFLIDTDTASDDAVALILALRWHDVEVEAITVVSGNCPVDQGVTNALYTAQLCGVEVPVYRGADRPLTRPPVHAEWFHGSDGMGNQNYPKPNRPPEKTHAVEAMIETIKANPGIVVVTLGPLTNVALAVGVAPEIADNVSRCIVMGGAANVVGNVTPAAEYNIWCDPEAARMVFHSGMPIEMLGWELSRGAAVLNETDINHLRGMGKPLADFIVDCNISAIDAFYVQTGERGIALPDPIAMAYALDPALCPKTSRHYVDVETTSELTRGMTVVDQLGVAHDERNRETWRKLLGRGAPNATICWELDAARWKAMLYSVL